MKDRHKIGVVYGALAFDARVADQTRRRRLDAAEANDLAAALRRNLIAECAEVRALRLVIGAAYYAPCALLRVGWPLHRRLRALRPCADDAGDWVATVAGDGLPEPRGAADAHHPLSLPFVLEGPIEHAREAARHFDRNRMLPYTPRARNPAFELPALPAFDAVGYLSLRGLSTEIAGRHYADGLGDAWALIERALLHPTLEHRVELRWRGAAGRAGRRAPAWLRYADGRVWIACGDPAYAERCRRLLDAHGLRAERAQTPADAEHYVDA